MGFWTFLDKAVRDGGEVQWGKGLSACFIGDGSFPLLASSLSDFWWCVVLLFQAHAGGGKKSVLLLKLLDHKFITHTSHTHKMASKWFGLPIKNLTLPPFVFTGSNKWSASVQARVGTWLWPQSLAPLPPLEKRRTRGQRPRQGKHWLWP